MVKLVCPADNPRAEGLECAKTCQNYDLQCMSTGCVSGCLCPQGMVSHPCHGVGVGSFAFSCGHNLDMVVLEQREEKPGMVRGWGWWLVEVVMGAGVGGSLLGLTQLTELEREVVGRCLEST